MQQSRVVYFTCTATAAHDSLTQRYSSQCGGIACSHCVIPRPASTVLRSMLTVYSTATGGHSLEVTPALPELNAGLSLEITQVKLQLHNNSKQRIREQLM